MAVAVRTVSMVVAVIVLVVGVTVRRLVLVRMAVGSPGAVGGDPRAQHGESDRDDEQPGDERQPRE